MQCSDPYTGKIKSPRGLDFKIQACLSYLFATKRISRDMDAWPTTQIRAKDQQTQTMKQLLRPFTTTSAISYRTLTVHRKRETTTQASKLSERFGRSSKFGTHSC